jgi:hypothetical protein
VFSLPLCYRLAVFPCLPRVYTSNGQRSSQLFCFRYILFTFPYMCSRLEDKVPNYTVVSKHTDLMTIHNLYMEYFSWRLLRALQDEKMISHCD